MIDLTPKQIVSELNRFIIGQVDAKKAVSAPKKVTTTKA